MSDATDCELICQPDRGRAAVMHDYHGRRAVLSTKHDKLRLIGPSVLRHVGLVVDAVPVDTDRLGTFTGDIARSGSAWETAVAKARIGMRAERCPVGIASEGSIGPHPSAPFINAAIELVVLVDDELGIVIGESETGFDIVAVGADITPGDNIELMLKQGQFPAHAMTVRPAVGVPLPTYKGIRTLRELERAVGECASVSCNSRARIETDLRAHQCPTRRPIITRAAERLAVRLAACCPECNTPGWGIVRLELGLPCELCGRSLSVPRADVFGCSKCPAVLIVNRRHAVADPAGCQWCNP
jgi:hypothetical protein